jgi:hypothetical protein
VSTDGATPRAGTLVVGTGVGMAASYALNEETPGTMSGSSNISNGRIEDVSEMQTIRGQSDQIDLGVPEAQSAEAAAMVLHSYP